MYLSTHKSLKFNYVIKFRRFFSLFYHIDINKYMTKQRESAFLYTYDTIFIIEVLIYVCFLNAQFFEAAHFNTF